MLVILAHIQIAAQISIANFGFRNSRYTWVRLYLLCMEGYRGPIEENAGDQVGTNIVYYTM